MLAITKGGRGNKAPYQTIMARIPAPLKPQVQELVDQYRDYVEQGGEALCPPLFSASKPVNDFKKVEDDLRQELAELKRERDQLDREVNDLHERNGDLHLELSNLKEQLATVQWQPAQLLKAVNKFIELKQSEWGKNPAQKGEFSTASRTWDMLKQFKQLLEEQPQKLQAEGLKELESDRYE